MIDNNNDDDDDDGNNNDNDIVVLVYNWSFIYFSCFREGMGTVRYIRNIFELLLFVVDECFFMKVKKAKRNILISKG